MDENGKNGQNEKKNLALGFKNFYCTIFLFQSDTVMEIFFDYFLNLYKKR